MIEQAIARKGSFDAAHRVLNEKLKCFNLHGHTYLYDLIFKFHEQADIGYLMDFKEIKRIAIQWIEDHLDHGCLLNPLDHPLIEAALTINSKIWLMSLNGDKAYCNPSVENIAKELFLAMELLFSTRQSFSIEQVILYETPACYTYCFNRAITLQEREYFKEIKGEAILAYASLKGIVIYDDRQE